MKVERSFQVVPPCSEHLASVNHPRTGTDHEFADDQDGSFRAP